MAVSLAASEAVSEHASKNLMRCGQESGGDQTLETEGDEQKRSAQPAQLAVHH